MGPLGWGTFEESDGPRSTELNRANVQSSGSHAQRVDRILDYKHSRNN